MINNEEFKPHFTEVLYSTLRQIRPNYDPKEYKWRLGAAVIYDLDSLYKMGIAHSMILKKAEKPTLYGIEIEVDHENPYNLQLFEDITNKIAVKKEDEVLNKLLEYLVKSEIDIPCDYLNGSNYCCETCHYDKPVKECWLKWAEAEVEADKGGQRC